MKTRLFRTKRITKKSQKLFLKSSKIICQSHFLFHGSSLYPPLFIKKASGPYIWDEDNNKYIDYTCGNGSLILGHANPAIVKEVRKLAPQGFSVGYPTKLELRLAELVTKYIPSIEMLQFTCTLSEACSSALTLARIYTDRSLILVIDEIGLFEYTHKVQFEHGLFIFISENCTIEKIQEVFNEHQGKIAAVLFLPLTRNYTLYSQSFIQQLRALCNINHTVLIFDESITGFRLTLGGIQRLYNVTPDITLLGGIIGGGYPLAAFGGKQTIMEPDSVHHMYKYYTLQPINIIALAAGYQTLRILATNKMIYKHLELRGQELENGIREILYEFQHSFTFNRIGSIFSFQTGNDTNTESSSQHSHYMKFLQHCSNKGIALPWIQQFPAFLSTAHTDKIIDKTITIFKQVLQ
ncbi:MAG: aminotransferase class III-fold pyridoxal phosphate-dependent enzyme [Bacteroidetes bacterium]|nr:aminotransferase class III-fold pyridoxal phosphate-dependent enzyme [Bacteroidota bacterium]